MSVTKFESDFESSSVGASARTWQIDNDRLHPPLHDGEWESALAEALVDLAEAHDTSTLTCFFYAGASVDFGHAGVSVWVALAGSGPIAKAAGDILREMIPPDFIRPAASPSDASWMPRIRIAEGKVWRPYDGAEWMALSPPDDVGPELEEDDLESSGPAEAPGGASAASGSRKRKKVLNAAREDVKVGYYQRKIERLLSLPEGSVKFVNPDRSISHPAQMIGSLRSRWDDA